MHLILVMGIIIISTTVCIVCLPSSLPMSQHIVQNFHRRFYRSRRSNYIKYIQTKPYGAEKNKVRRKHQPADRRRFWVKQYGKLTSCFVQRRFNGHLNFLLNQSIQQFNNTNGVSDSLSISNVVHKESMYLISVKCILTGIHNVVSIVFRERCNI